MTSSFDLAGKVILITGGAGFLGQHFTRSLLEAGAKVVATDVTHGASVRLDVTDPASVAEAFAKVEKEMGPIDVVINNAAIDPKFDKNADANTKSFENYPDELLRLSLDVNLRGYVLVAQAAIRHMIPRGKGHIINVSSMYGLVGPDQRLYPEGTQKPVDYFVTKGGVVMLTKFLATTYGARGVRANTYTLGGVFKDHPTDFVERYSARVPLGRMAKIEEVGSPLVFLASDASAYMTGSNLVVDGGWTAW